MKKLVRTILILLLAAGALAVFKPTEKDFETWMNNQSSKKRGNAKGDNVVEKLVDKGAITATQLQVLATYEYYNHLVFATVEAHANGEKIIYLGVARTWIKLP